MWRLSGTTACWESGRFQARVDVAHPERGIGHVAWDRHALPAASLMQMYLQPDAGSCSIQLEDCYVRGADLMARYVDISQHVMVPEFCWRICDSATESDAVVIESLLSVHTQLLDSNPEVTVQCELSADRYQVWRLQKRRFSRTMRGSVVAEPAWKSLRQGVPWSGSRRLNRWFSAR